jgi:UDP-glucose 4-epimerase
MLRRVRPATWPELTGCVCVVTGGAGFIGSNLAHALVGVGATVRVVDALVPEHGGDRRNLDGIDVDLLVCEIGDPCVAEALAGADVVFNLAGQVSHLASMLDPLRDLHLNAVSHASFLEIVRRVCPQVRIVHASTRQVYGRASRLPVDELHHAQPVDVNGVAKLAGEQLHLVHHHAYGLAATSLRLTNLYGPRQRLTSDELGFLPVFVRCALSGTPIRIFGDGLQRRDVVYVDDAVDAILAATSERAVGEVLNVGHDEDHTVLEIALALVEAAGGEPPVLVPWPPDHRAIDIGSFHTDGRRIRERLGWRATTQLRDGLARTIDFYRRHPWYLSST